MRKPLSRPGRDDCGTSQTSIRHQPPRRRAMREYAVAPIHAGGVALRHVGPPGCDLSPALDLDVKPSSYRRTARRGPPPATETSEVVRQGLLSRKVNLISCGWPRVLGRPAFSPPAGPRPW